MNGRARSIFFEFPLGRGRVDHSIHNFERYSIKKLATSAWWSGNAFAAIWLIVSVMGLTHQILALIGKELIVNPIHRHRYVTTAIHVSMKAAPIIDDKAFLVGTLDRKQEFL